MLKLVIGFYPYRAIGPAAFRRLCVETAVKRSSISTTIPAAFRRLCVETGSLSILLFGVAQPPSGGCVLKRVYKIHTAPYIFQPPSGGCVLKPLALSARNTYISSRLQAAVC